MYHRVLPAEERRKSFSSAGIVVHSDTFAKQMDYIGKALHVVSVDEFIEKITRKEPFQNGTCLITFDDGWLDNYLSAYPVLNDRKLPALIFLPAAYIGTGRRFWREETAAVLFRVAGDASDTSRELLVSLGLPLLSEVPANQVRIEIEAYLAQMKAWPREKREAVLSRIRAYQDALPQRPRDTDAFIDWEQVREMAKHRISFGSHGYRHDILTQLDYAEAEEDITRSKEVIEQNLATVVRTFAYPNGNYDRELTGLVAKAGYEAAFTVGEGVVRSGDNPFTLRRINMHEDMTNTRALFLARILGIF